MPHQKSSDYKETAFQYYLVEDKTQDEICRIFKCSRRSLMRWVKKYKKDGKIYGYERTPKYPRRIIYEWLLFLQLRNELVKWAFSQVHYEVGEMRKGVKNFLLLLRFTSFLLR